MSAISCAVPSRPIFWRATNFSFPSGPADTLAGFNSLKNEASEGSSRRSTLVLKTLVAVADGVNEAVALLREGNAWLIGGILAYLIFDVMILWATFGIPLVIFLLIVVARPGAELTQGLLFWALVPASPACVAFAAILRLNIPIALMTTVAGTANVGSGGGGSAGNSTPSPSNTDS